MQCRTAICITEIEISMLIWNEIKISMLWLTPIKENFHKMTSFQILKGKSDYEELRLSQ